MEITPGFEAHGFTFCSSEDLPEIEGRAHVARHKESGARLLYLQNDDVEKSFSIGFRTPPQDDTGVFHILEHSVLCGSRRFPVKEPFVDLLKGSMQTFLNAMTFADKTLYPVATTNEQDLFNLMDVYLDAVFHPRIYEKRAIFEQEGWHLELRAGEGTDPVQAPAESVELAYNGVVFNEMKGALSDANAVLYYELQKALFPDTCYAFESGGTPEAIPTLTYEDYLADHARHYRTENSYIVLYGDLDIDRALAFLDERYLTPVAAEQKRDDARRASEGLPPLLPRTIEAQPPLDAGYAAVPMDTAPENACCACGYVLGTSSDRERVAAADILLDALFGSNEAPLKRALLDAGVAHDVLAYASDGILQPFAVVQLQMPQEGAGENLADTLAAETRKLLESGLDKDVVEASIAHAEFALRERNMGYADGVVYAMTSLAGWLYDEEAPVDYLRYEQLYEQLRSHLDGDYYERLAEELFCKCRHTASVEVVPRKPEGPGLEQLALAELKAGLTSDERARIAESEAALRELQEAPDAPEAVATLPRLRVSDIGPAPQLPPYEIDWRTPMTCIRHTVPTRGIVYATRYFDLAGLDYDELPYASILARVLGKLDTAEHTAAQLDTLATSKLGNLTFRTVVHGSRNDPSAAAVHLAVDASALSSNVSYLTDLVREVLTQTDFSNSGKILDLLKQRKIHLEQTFSNSGHSCAMERCKSYYSKAGILADLLGNVEHYRFVCDLIDHYDQRCEQLAAKLVELSQRIFNDASCTVSFAGSSEDYDAFWLSNPGCGNRVAFERRLEVPEPVVRNEGFVVPTDVCFTALAWDYRLLDADFSGAWAIASRALSYDYLWNEVRVKGGAYGTGFSAGRMGSVRFYSYRDPHLDETIARFTEAPRWLAEFDPTDDEFEGYIVSCVAALDRPKKPRTLVREQADEYFALCRREELLELRDEVVKADIASVRAAAPVIERACQNHALCAFGNGEIIGNAKEELEVVNLVG